ncbi:MAG TPA: hypothetical protein VL551_17105 [Actinospica sp.]|jgi:hypothetical protein|nr:hypothetical protein [Actinospica sp.]
MARWECWNAWTLAELPRLNRAVLAGSATPGQLGAELSRAVLEQLPRPEDFDAVQARRVLVLLGLAGASVARHHQEADVARKARPEESFGRLRVGPDADAFSDYFTRLAYMTGAGHPERDSYASLVRWNAPTTVVERDGVVLAELPGVFPDPRIRTYTDDPGEVAFFELLKKSEALEAAVNRALDPVADGAVDPLGPEGTARALDATRLMYALIRFNRDFAERGPERGGLRTEHFMDVFRQFAVHWRVGDVPPTGAQDPEFLRRDFLLGIDFPDYGRHVRRVFPGLLAGEREVLERDMLREPLPRTVLRALGTDAEGLDRLTGDQIRGLLARAPALAAWYLLLSANAVFGGVHLRLTEKYLFKPQRVRDAAGIGDRELVSNRRGTTGMEEPLLVRLARARREHPLRAVGRVPEREVAAFCGFLPDASGELRLPTVRFAGEG